MTEILALKKMVVFSKSEFPNKVLNSTTNPYAPSEREVQWLYRAEFRTAMFIVIRQNTYLVVGEQFIHVIFEASAWSYEERNSVPLGMI